MKRMAKRLGALALALTMALTAMQGAFASWALGSELIDRTVELAEGLTLTDGSLWSASRSDLRTEHYLTYTPGSGVTPVVFSGKFVASTNTLAAAAAQLEAQGWRVAGGVNGGFFNADGTIVGMLLTEGVLRSLGPENFVMLGFTAEGQVFLDDSRVKQSVTWTRPDGTAAELPLFGFNAYRNDMYLNGLFLYNQDFSSRVLSGGPNVTVVLRPVETEEERGAMTMNGTLTLEVVQVADNTVEDAVFDGAIPEGCYMLYAEEHDNAALLDELRALVEGQQVQVAVSGAGEQWADAVYGVSGLYALLQDGEIAPGLPSGANPYTAVGLREDGSAIFYTIDGRRSGYSVGASYDQVAQRLQELGCVSAVALDGGGSTILGATLPGSDSFAVVSRTSGGLRALNNSILFLTPGEATGELGGLYVTGENRVVLAGAKLTVEATACDTAGYPMDSVTPVWTAEGGTIEGTEGSAAVFTAGEELGTWQVAAAFDGLEGTMPVRVVTNLSSLTVSRESGGAVSRLLLSPGDEVELTASALWYNLPVTMEDTDVVWTAEGVGEIDETGRFTAVNDNAEGVLTASAGNLTVTIPVKVDRGDPFTDMGGHWGAEYVTELYKLGITTGIQLEDGSWIFNPDSELSRGELLVFIARLLELDTAQYEAVELPFADQESIPEWMLPSVKALYALQIFQGASNGETLTANVWDKVNRESAMTMLGRVLLGSEACDLSEFADGGGVSGWALSYVQTLVARGVVSGSGGMLYPQDNINRASVAKLLVLLNAMEKAELQLRPELLPDEEPQPGEEEPGEQEPDQGEPQPGEQEPDQGEPQPGEEEPDQGEPRPDEQEPGGEADGSPDDGAPSGPDDPDGPLPEPVPDEGQTGETP